MLHRFFQTGRYEPPRRDGKDFVAVTNAPSMDIAKSSNFERMLFDIVGGDALRVRGWYDDLARDGYFQVDEQTLRDIQTIFISASSTDTERLDAIRYMATQYRHGIDPHTAAAVVPWLRSRQDQDVKKSEIPDTPIVFLETSHVAQFSEELQAKGIIVPGMHEFDTVLDTMRSCESHDGLQYLHTGSNLSSIFPDIVEVLDTILPSKF